VRSSAGLKLFGLNHQLVEAPDRVLRRLTRLRPVTGFDRLYDFAKVFVVFFDHKGITGQKIFEIRVDVFMQGLKNKSDCQGAS
jgi:hypothetical protein